MQSGTGGDPTLPGGQVPDWLAAAGEPAALLPALLGMAESASIGIALQHAGDRRYLYLNRTLGAILGCAPERLIGATAAERLAAGLAAALHAAETRALALDAPGAEMHRIGGATASSWRVVRQRLPGAQPLLCSVWVEVREVRTAFQAQLRRELDLMAREQREFSLLMVEHRADGSTSPVTAVDPIGALLHSNLRAMDTVLSLGADRHAVLLSGVGLAVARARGVALLRRCEDRHPALRVSIGIASCPHTASDGDTLVMAAGRALERARAREADRVALAAIRFQAPG